MGPMAYGMQLPPVDALPLESWMGGVPPVKRARIERLHFKRDKALALVAHRLLQLALHRAGLPRNLEGWREEPGGKPFLLDLPGVHFSLSHSGQAVLCLLGGERLGVDVERVRRVEPAVADRVLCPGEMEEYRGSGEDPGLFMEFWTLKESYMKFKGTGLRLPPGKICLLPRPPGDARFHRLPVGSGYRAAACGEGLETPEMIWVHPEEIRRFDALEDG